jgi:ankyrin repeat protein
MASGNNVNILLYPAYTSPLHIAATAGSKEAVLTLLGHGAFPNILNLEKNSPFHEVKYI